MVAGTNKMLPSISQLPSDHQLQCISQRGVSVPPDRPCPALPSVHLESQACPRSGESDMGWRSRESLKQRRVRRRSSLASQNNTTHEACLSSPPIPAAGVLSVRRDAVVGLALLLAAVVHLWEAERSHFDSSSNLWLILILVRHDTGCHYAAVTLDQGPSPLSRPPSRRIRSLCSLLLLPCMCGWRLSLGKDLGSTAWIRWQWLDGRPVR